MVQNFRLRSAKTWVDLATPETLSPGCFGAFGIHPTLEAAWSTLAGPLVPT